MMQVGRKSGLHELELILAGTSILNVLHHDLGMSLVKPYVLVFCYDYEKEVFSYSSSMRLSGR